MSVPTVSVIICAYTEQRLDDLRRSIRSVAAQTVPAAEIVVVIDHNPTLHEQIASEGLPCRVVANDRTNGLAGARTTGIHAATGEAVAFLDDDAMADPEWLASLVPHLAEADVLGVGGAIRPLWPDGLRPAWFPAEFDWVVGCSYRGMPEAAASVRNVLGCNMLFRRNALIAVGGFTRGRVGRLRLGHENDETDLCLRIAERFPGTRIVYEPAGVVRHVVPAERARLRYFLERCLSEGISKARLTRERGAEALGTERAHVRRTLSAALVREGRGVMSPSSGAAARIAVLLLGTAATVGGFLAGGAMALVPGRSGAVPS
jgi:glycosyltransferase involved in cell wall biosynthesis